MLLSTTYFGPIQWFSKLFQNQGKETYIEACETFQKLTFRNRCVIATANGQLPLTVPVSHRNGAPICDTLISDHGNWRHLHWQALQTAYGESAFFEYYEDSLRPFFFDEGRASYFTLSREVMKKYSYIKGDAEGLVNMPLQIKGMRLSISLREDTEKPNLIWVSLRSVDDFPCNKMAGEYFNGGGHHNASGGRLFCSLAEAEEIAKRAIRDFKY